MAEGVMVARVIKRCQRNRVVAVMRRVVAGSEAEVISRVIATQRSMRALINTAYIERLQATFRARLAPLVRQTRAGAHKHCTLEAGMWLVGSCYNLLWAHRSLGEERTPAMAARAYRSSLVDGGVVDVCGATRRTAQMAWAKAEVAAGGRGCTLTTLQCGAFAWVERALYLPLSRRQAWEGY